MQTVPPTLKLSKEEVVFTFAPENWENAVSQTVVLSNPNTHQADFGWEMSSPAFSVSPSEGTVLGRGQVPCVITWLPAQQPELNNGVGVVRIDRGGSSQRVSLMGELPKASAAFEIKLLTLKPASVGAEIEGIVHLKNTGGVDAVFFVEQPADQPLATFGVSPMRGRIAPGASVELTVRFSAVAPATYTVPLRAAIRGGDAIALQIVADVLLPDVSVAPPLIDFGKMSQGSIVRQMVTIQNTSPISAALELDLRKFPSLTVNLPASSWSSDEYAVPPLRAISGQHAGEGHGRASVRSSNSRAVSNPNYVMGVKPERPHQGNKYQIDILPQRSISFELVYVADEATADDSDALESSDGAAPRLLPSLDTFLPLSLANTSGDPADSGGAFEGSRSTASASGASRERRLPPELAGEGAVKEPGGTPRGGQQGGPPCVDEHTAAANAKLRCRVVAFCLRPRLSLSDTVVDFQECTVMRERVKRLPYQFTVSFVNDSTSEIAWAFGAMTPSSSPRVTPEPQRAFTLSPLAGTLGPGEGQKVTVGFAPRTPAEFAAVIPVFLDGQAKKAYISLELMGRGVLPRLSFSVREVVLPAVPLGVTSRATVIIQSHGYDNLAVTAKLPQDTDHAPIELSFPEGNVIGLAKDRLPCVISFRSAVPTSFTAPIDFLDGDGRRFSLPVVGIAEPSALTCAQFFMANAHVLDVAAPDHSAITLVENEDYRLPEVAPGKFGIQHSPCLMRWLNASAAALGPFDTFPGRFATTRGKLLRDLIELWGGEKVAEKVLPTQQQLLQQKQLESQQALLKQPASATAAAAAEFPVSAAKSSLDSLVETFDKILLLLRANGACLNHVKPEHLLDKDDITRFLNAKEARLLRLGPIDDADNDVLQHWRADAEDCWDEISAATWHSVLFELVKVYCVARASPKALKNLAGMSQALISESTLTASTLYSSGECALLSWITHHFSRGLPEHSFRVTNFSNDLRTGFALLGLVSSHSPSAADLVSAALHDSPRPADDRANARLLLDILSRLQLDLSMTEDELVRPVEHEMVLFAYYLFTSLPALLPRSTIEFHSRLQERTVKSVVVSNPTPRRVAYAARLEGAVDFALERTQVQVEARGSASVAVACVPQSSRPAEGRLILAPHVRLPHPVAPSDEAPPACAPPFSTGMLRQPRNGTCSLLHRISN